MKIEYINDFGLMLRIMAFSIGLVLMIFDLTIAHHVIQPSPIVAVIEGSDATFSCTYNHQDNEQFFVTISRYYTTYIPYVKYFTGCDFSVNATNVTCSDFGNVMTIAVILTTGTYSNEEVWFCLLTGEHAIANTTIYINIPVTTLDVIPSTNGTIDVVERVSFEFRCQSRGRPIPVIEWYKQTVDGPEILIITGVSSNSFSDTEIESILEFSPTKDDNGYRIYCKAYNTIPDDAMVSQYKPLLKVIYMPNGPPTILNHINGSDYAVIERTLQTSTCTITGGNPLANLTWDCFDGTVQQSTQGDIVSSTATWSGQRKHNGICECRSQHIAANATVGFTVDVLYPPTTPIIRYKLDNGNETSVQNIKMLHEQNATFTCNIESNPVAKYSWSTGQSKRQAEVVVHKDLTEITCTVTNEMKPSKSGQQTGTNSSFIGVTILYPPTTPTLTYAASSTIPQTITTTTIDVVSGDTFSIECTADGNPVPVYNWSHQDQSLQADSALSIVNVQSDDYTKYRCTASNVLDPTFGHKMPSFSSANVSLNILYGPSTPEIYYEDSNGSKPIVTTLAVIEHTSFNVKCESTSNPRLNEYKWQGQTGQHLVIRNISAGDPSIYTCGVTNVMIRTYGERVIGRNFTTLTVDVLYPPDVQYLPNMTLEEGNTLHVTCAISKGNPHSNTVFRWLDTFSVITSTAVLEIHNITRNHSGMYACLVYNSLQPTFGKMENGSDIESFNLDVFYKASITQFYTEWDGIMYTNVTINETDAFNVLCSVNSNPNSNIIITRDGQRIANRTNVVNINHVVESATCDDGGIYTCTGYNPYIQDKSLDTADIRVNVRCYPRATKPVENITAAAQNDTVQFNATFIAYPVPRDEDYIWRKQRHDSSWIVLESNDRINISRGYLKTHLIIHEIRQSDYGNYSLTVSNNVVKEYAHIFELIPHEAPGKPENVQVTVLENNEVFCSWRHGFNGGYKQTFVIQLRTDKRSWYNITFDLRRNVTSQHCWTILNDLDFDKFYYIRIFSFNILGRSDIVIDPELKFKIESEQIELTNTDSTVGVIVGVVVSVIVVISIAAVAVLHYRRNSNADKDTGMATEPKSKLKTYVCCYQRPSKSNPRPNDYVNVNFNDTRDASGSGSLLTETIVTTVKSKKSETVAYSSGGNQLTETSITSAGSSKSSYSSASQLTKTPVTLAVSGIKGSAACNNGSRLTETPETPKRTGKRETIEMEALEHAYCNVFKDKSFGIADLRALSMSVRQHPKKLDEQFKGFINGKRFSTKAAEKLTNKTKNRYKEMHPYDKNRIVLPVIKGNPDSDYINASSIKGYSKNSRNYIASQAALENTLPDYWRMIWTQNVTQIVMLTNCIEHGRLKCYKYWPDDNSNIYGKITVRAVTEDVYSEYTVRVFDIRMKGSSKTVTQYHFTAWPDKDVPDTCVSLVQLWKMVKEGTKDTTSPLMVHCSAGVGRTGTFLALDYLYDQGKAEGFVNFYECVVKLREQRMTMVQTVDQYAFLHHAVLEALDPLVEVCKTDTFRDLRQRLLKPENSSGPTQLKTEYRMIEAECHVEVIPTVGEGNKGVATTPKRDEFGDSRIQQNKDKSRCQDILASDLYRPVLEMVVPGGGDYINAVVLSTYRFIDRMIITQVPMSNTVIDFLRMVWDFDVSTIILMQKDIPKTDMYWPASGKRSFGIFEAEVVVGKETVGKSFTKRTIRYTVKGTNGQEEQKDVLILQFTVWPEDKLPDHKAMTSLIAELERKHVMTNTDAPFVVQCMDGATKSGLFCVLWSILERMKFKREVAISETVRFLRTRRKQIIRNYEQYQYCYDLVQQYLDEFEVYNNVV